jgi:hypothetical protein
LKAEAVKKAQLSINPSIKRLAKMGGENPLFSSSTFYLRKYIVFCQALIAHACNPGYLGVREQEDHGSKPAPSK